MKCFVIQLAATAASAAVILAGCTRTPGPAAPSPTTSADAIVIFQPPEPARVLQTQRDVSRGREPWRADPFEVARAELAALLESPPEKLNNRLRRVVSALSPAEVRRVSDYRLLHDAGGGAHVVFEAGPYVIDALMDSVRPDEKLPGIWVTRTVTLRRATQL